MNPWLLSFNAVYSKPQPSFNPRLGIRRANGHSMLGSSSGLFRAALASSLVGLTEACLPKKAEGEGLTIDRRNFENHILGRSSRIFPKRIERTPTERLSSLVTHPSKARSGTFASGNLD